MVPRTLVWLGLLLLLISYGLVRREPPAAVTAASGRPLVVIDPGHGGVDPGAISASGIQEKSINLAVSLVAAHDLQTHGIAVALTRQSDRPALQARRFIVVDDLYFRSWMAHHLGATLFLSIHSNSEPTGTVAGPIMYYVAGRESSHQLARDLAQAFARTFGRTPQIRTIRQLVLLEMKVPATTVELGFLTNRQDAIRLSNGAYQRALGAAISQGVVQYLRHG